jgi:hypothetical protein
MEKLPTAEWEASNVRSEKARGILQIDLFKPVEFERF